MKDLERVRGKLAMVALGLSLLGSSDSFREVHNLEGSCSVLRPLGTTLKYDINFLPDERGLPSISLDNISPEACLSFPSMVVSGSYRGTNDRGLRELMVATYRRRF